MTRTNVVLDDALIQEAMEVTGLSSKRAVVEEALRMLVRMKSQATIRDLRGQLQWEGDLDASRTDRLSETPNENGPTSPHVDR